MSFETDTAVGNVLASEAVEGEVVAGGVVTGGIEKARGVASEVIEGEVVGGAAVGGEMVRKEAVMEGEVIGGEVVEKEAVVEGEVIEGEVVDEEAGKGEVIEGEVVEERRLVRGEEMTKEEKGAMCLPVGGEGELWEWIRKYVGIEVPRRSFCGCHSAPFDYIKMVYFHSDRDVVVWGPRGGGKTRLAALATLLDLLHRPGFGVRVLGGSAAQSSKIWEHLVPDLKRLVPDLIDGKIFSTRLRLKTGASAAALPQSQYAVRGVRVEKLRCDEVEMFRPQVWSAAGAVTRSMKLGNGRMVGGGVEAISTYHESNGMMAEILHKASINRTPVLSWCILDVMAKCERPAEACGSCELWKECGGKARERRPDGSAWAEGFVPVEDVIATKRRVSEEMWESELLCRRPARKGRVFQQFCEGEHVGVFEVADVVEGNLQMGVDFGYRNPFVALFLARGKDGRVYVVDEYVCTEKTVCEHLVEMRKSKPWVVWEVACDPAGNSRNEQTGRTSVNLLRKAELHVKTKSTKIIDGIEAIRKLIKPAVGGSKLVIHPRCATLIEALREYRYDEKSRSELPLKDGEFDHPIDALRYWVMNEEGGGEVGSKAGY